MKRLPKGHKAQIMGTRMFQTMYTAEQMRKFAQQQESVACAAPMACSGADKCVFRTSPQPSKPWVGLTDEEIEELASEVDWSSEHAPWNFNRRIEAKLKEKNNG